MNFMDNEEPRRPPEKIQIENIPRAVPLVPEVTLYSPANPQNNTASIFGNLKKHQYPPLRNQTTNVFQNGTSNQPFPTVPDVSIMDQVPPVQRRPLNENLIVFPKMQQKSSSNYNPANQRSKENLQTQIPKPVVPDLTIYEPKKVPVNQEQPKNNLVFDANYKKYLLESHQHFMKQFKSDSVPENENKAQKKTIFNSKPVFKENPLAKYAPKIQNHPQKPALQIPAQPVIEDHGNSSSILIDVDQIIEQRQTVAKKSQEPEDLEMKSDEDTFKKVAEMLNEMQRLAGFDESPVPIASPTKRESEADILRRLASRYLTQEELKFYNVERELDVGRNLQR